jgi:diguanylate cyclase (GGDEF)-like protein
MAVPMICTACGEVTRGTSCTFCGARLPLPSGDARSDMDWDQETSDQDQTASDQDQTWSDHDQSASDNDQRTADEDQHAADEDLSAGGDPTSHERGALARERSSHERAAVSALRDETATARVGTSDARDATASVRDQALSDRDELARLHELDDQSEGIREDILLRAKKDRARAAADRAKAAEDRSRAATDRELAARERAQAHDERAESALNLKLSTRDDLTGAWTRKFGLEAISRELERAHRTGSKLVVAFVDVDGLKAVNDTEGHLAGDALLELVGETLRTSVRPYDIVVRYGGDEFVCGMPNLGAEQARARFQTIAATLTAAYAEHSISFGLAEAGPGDTLKELITRADAALLEGRR